MALLVTARVMGKYPQLPAQHTMSSLNLHMVSVCGPWALVKVSRSPWGVLVPAYTELNPA